MLEKKYLYDKLALYGFNLIPDNKPDSHEYVGTAFCPNDHKCLFSYHRQVILKRRPRCHSCTFIAGRPTIQQIDKILQQSESDLERVSKSVSTFKKIEFLCKKCQSKNFLKFEIFKRDPRCQTCKKEKFNHSALTKKLRNFALAKKMTLVGKYRGMNVMTTFLDPDGTRVNISPKNIGFGKL